MRKTLTRRVVWSVAALLCGCGLLSTGCEEQLMTTVQDGIISAGSSMLGAVIEAAMNLALEQANS